MSEKKKTTKLCFNNQQQQQLIQQAIYRENLVKRLICHSHAFSVECIVVVWKTLSREKGQVIVQTFKRLKLACLREDKHFPLVYDFSFLVHH